MWFLYWALLGLNVIDAFATMFETRGSDEVESNPMMYQLLVSTGNPWIIFAFKTVMLLALAWGILKLGQRNPRWLRATLKSLTMVYAGLAVWHGFILFYMLVLT